MEEPNNVVTMYTDGSCAPVNPNGYASCGILIQHQEETYTASKFLGVGMGYSSYLAEYAGLEMGLETLMSLGLGDHEIVVYVDMVMVFEHLFDNRTPERKHGYYKHYKNVARLWKEFGDIHMEQVGSKHNLADPLAKGVLKQFSGTAKWKRMRDKGKESRKLSLTKVAKKRREQRRKQWQ